MLPTAGVATAFAARDILGNFLNGAALYLYTPFSIGDNIKVSVIILSVSLTIDRYALTVTPPFLAVRHEQTFIQAV